MANARPAWNGLKIRPLVATIFAIVLAAGCGSNPAGESSGNDTVAPTSAHQRLSGVLHGGQNAIAGATVTLYAVAEDGFGSHNVTELATTTTDYFGHYTISSFDCPSPSAETYIVATGGSAESDGGNNNAIALMAAIGPCGQIVDATTVAINELTTIAAQWALQQFADSTGHDIGAPSSDLTGLANAYVSFTNLANQNPGNLSVNGEPSSFLPIASECGAGMPPLNCDALERLDTLADIIAACVNSSGPDSTACQQLFCDATPGRSYGGGICSGSGTEPTDTLAAAHSIAINPTVNVAGLFELPTPDAPFYPLLAALPDGWEIALNFAPSDAEFDTPGALALDGSGNVFVANSEGADDGSVSELPVSTGYSTGLNFAAAGAVFDGPSSIAVDGSNNLFVTNSAGNSVSELTQSSAYTAGSNFTPSGADLDGPVAIAMDSFADLFAANPDSNSVSELNSTDYATLGSNYAPTLAYLDRPVALALDSSANVFVANADGNSVSELTESSSYLVGIKYAPPAADFDSPSSIALDGGANVFVANSGNNSVSELTESSTYTTGLNFAPPGAAFSSPDSIALDGSANAWVVNFGTGSVDTASVSELTAGSTYGTGFNFAPAGGAFFDSPAAIAVDSSGNLFIVNQAGNSVTQLIGLATPVPTPLEPGNPEFVVGGGGVAVLVFLSLLMLWYAFRFLMAATRRVA